MSESRIQFRFVIKATPEQITWLQNVHEACQYSSESTAPNDSDMYIQARTILSEPDVVPGELHFYPHKDTVIVYAYKGGHIGYTTLILNRFLNQFDIPMVIGFEWSSTTTIHIFGGGAAVVSKHHIKSISTSELCAELFIDMDDKDV